MGVFTSLPTNWVRWTALETGWSWQSVEVDWYLARGPPDPCNLTMAHTLPRSYGPTPPWMIIAPGLSCCQVTCKAASTGWAKLCARNILPPPLSLSIYIYMLYYFFVWLPCVLDRFPIFFMATWSHILIHGNSGNTDRSIFTGHLQSSTHHD